MTDEERVIGIGIKYTPNEQVFEAMLDAKHHLEEVEKSDYLCESCGRQDSLTPDQAYHAGWDYPPFIGMWGIVSPRTCPNCTIDTTAYWAIITQGTEALTPEQWKTVERIKAEVTPEELLARMVEGSHEPSVEGPRQ